MTNTTASARAAISTAADNGSVTPARTEGARFASLADNGLAEGEARTRDLITAAVGPTFATDIRVSYGEYAGHRSTEVRVLAPLPLLGLIGFDRGLEVVGRAAVETLE